jgi:hypothetical protein
MKEPPGMSTSKSFGLIRLTTKPKSAKRSQVSRVLRLAFALCALLAVTLYFLAPAVAHAAPARPAIYGDCGISPLAPYYKDAEIYPTPIKKPGPTPATPSLSFFQTFYSPSHQSYWVSVTNNSGQMIEVIPRVALLVPDAKSKSSHSAPFTSEPLDSVGLVFLQPGCTINSGLVTLQMIKAKVAKYQHPSNIFGKVVNIRGSAFAYNWQGNNEEESKSDPIPVVGLKL